MSRLKKILPKCYSDWFAFLVMIGLVQVICFFELLVVLPQMHALHDDVDTKHYWFHVIIGLFLYINVMLSMVMVVVTDTTSVGMMLPSILKPGWRFCSVCEHNAPPRSFHCWTCDVCVLRRDHHCVFTGNCIGHTNQRYYMLLVGYLCVGALYCNYLNMDYTWEVLGGLSATSVLSMTVPLLAWLLGLTEIFTFSVATLSATCIFGCLLLLALFIYHASNIYHGQITVERSYKVHDYDLGPLENIRQVFGESWYYAWLCPLIPSKLPGNGLEFQKITVYENLKNL